MYKELCRKLFQVTFHTDSVYSEYDPDSHSFGIRNPGSPVLGKRRKKDSKRYFLH